MSSWTTEHRIDLGMGSEKDLNKECDELFSQTLFFFSFLHLFLVRRPDKWRGHCCVCITGRSHRVLASSLLCVQHVQRAPGGPHLLLPGREDLLRSAPRREAEAALHCLWWGRCLLHHTHTPAHRRSCITRHARHLLEHTVPVMQDCVSKAVYKYLHMQMHSLRTLGWSQASQHTV